MTKYLFFMKLYISNGNKKPFFKKNDLKFV
jgi:hypothetical protein